MTMNGGVFNIQFSVVTVVLVYSIVYTRANLAQFILV